MYDGNGNPTTWDGTALTWNVENRMTAYGTALTAGYRGDGLRAWKQPGGGNPTYFLYDGISVLCELDDTGAVSASSAYGANGLLSRGTTQYQFDPLGDAVLLLDGAGDVAARQVFDGWGNALVTATGPFGYRGRYGYFADSETGLVALAYRYYGPGVGRFVNRDPIGYQAGPHLFSYIGNRPSSYSDRAGLQAYSPIMGPVVMGEYAGPYLIFDLEVWSEGLYESWAALGKVVWPDELARRYAGYDLWSEFDTSVGSAFWWTEALWSLGLWADFAGIGCHLGLIPMYALKIGIHAPHHAWNGIQYWHLQINWWIVGVKGSGGVYRLPVWPGSR